MPYQVLYGKELKQLRREQGTEAALSRPLLDIDAIRRNRVVITNYETVANYALTFATIPWSIVVADEAHTFKDPNTRIAYTMKALKANFRVAMTGTPIQNRMLDLWNLVDFLQPGPLLGSAKEFEAQYERRSVGEEEAKKATMRLRQRLRIDRHDAVLLRRTKEEHLPGLPQKRERVIQCPLTVEDQATDRVYRIGQERDVEVCYFVATDPLGRFTTFDEHLHSLISGKRRNARDFLEPQADADSLQSELLQQVRKDTKSISEAGVVSPSITPQMVAALSPSEFEALVAAMLEAEGYKTILTPYANDRGIDVIGIRKTEVLFIQCKHSQDGRSFERVAIDEVAYGETYYTLHLLPGALRERRPRLTVVANGEADSRAHREAELRGVQLFTGRSLFQRLTKAKVTRALLDRMEGQRINSLNDVRARLEEVATRTFS